MSHDCMTLGDVEIPHDRLQRAIEDFDGDTGYVDDIILADIGYDEDDVYVIVCGEGRVARRSLDDLRDMAVER